MKLNLSFIVVPDDRLNTKEVVSNSEYTVEIYYTINSYGSRVKKFRVLQQDATEVYMDVLFTDISSKPMKFKRADFKFDNYCISKFDNICE